ncbi:MAG: hypothetical protein HC905_08330 [Bacteroidales bacterium]|nr:hypothetical protein [Bacteroidales bacterium]
MEQSDQHYRSTAVNMDKTLFPDYGEFAVYWTGSDPEAGSFVLPHEIPSEFGTITSTAYSSYNWKNSSHRAIHFNHTPKKIAVFKSACIIDNSSISWEAAYFKNLFDSYLSPDIYYFVDEVYLSAHSLSDSTELIIFPAMNAKGSNYGFYSDSILLRCPTLKAKLTAFLEKGGSIYTEGNAITLLEKAGILTAGSVDYSAAYIPDKTGIVTVTASSHIIGTAAASNGGNLFASALPSIQLPEADIIASLNTDNRPVVFLLEGAEALNGKIICNTALPTVDGISKAGNNSRQLQWFLNSMLYAFSHSIDVTRSVTNLLPPVVTTGRNSVSYDRADTFDIKIVVRNLSDAAINNVVVKEHTGNYFKFLEVKTGSVAYSQNGNILTFGNLSLPARSEIIIEYSLTTPQPGDAIHESVDKLLEKGTLMKSSTLDVSYTENGNLNHFTRNKDYANIMFSARIFADTDINWKNFLGLDYQPFKVFMIMENKERTTAEKRCIYSVYPKRYPFYWSDNSINIPILRTPGGKFVDVLKGSNNENAPEYDMDGDGHPDAWLDTSSIYPKGYTIEEEMVYWANPWNHLRGENEAFVFEDIDHDGLTAKDINGDGIVDVEEPGDKIRTWKITWNIGSMPGHQYYDPYCSMEVWVDPPDLVPLSAGVGKAQGKLTEDLAGMFIPYKSGFNETNLADSAWANWMEHDTNGKVIYKTAHLSKNQ